MTPLIPRRGFLLALPLLLCLSPPADRIHVVLLHTNDVHGQAQPRRATWIDRDDPPLVGGLPRVAAYVKQVRAENDAVLVVDAGDWFQGTPEGSLDHGRVYMSAVAQVGYDALAVGNHDMDHGLDPLAAMIADFELPAVSASLYVEPGGKRVEWVEPYRIVEIAGLRIGLVGLLTPLTPSITHPDASTIHFEEPDVALKRALAELDGRVDWILPLSHLGIEADQRLAEAVPGIDLIVGGHSHTYLEHGLQQEDTLILHAGSKGSGVGRVDLWFDRESKELLEVKSKIVDLYDEPPPAHRNQRVTEICTELVERSEERMKQEVGSLATPLTRARSRFVSSPAGNLITDTMRERLGAQVAIQNRGGIRCDLEPGPVTRRGLFELLPFGNNPVLLEVSGEDLLTCLRAAVEGTAHSGLEVSGLAILYRELEGDRGELAGLEVEGKPVVPDGRYTLVTNNFLASGADGYDPLGQSKRLGENPILMRELLEERFRREGTVHPTGDNRYRRVR